MAIDPSLAYGAGATLVVGVTAAVLAYRGGGRTDAIKGYEGLVDRERKFYEMRVAVEHEDAVDAVTRAATAEARVKLLEQALREHDIPDPERRQQ